MTEVPDDSVAQAEALALEDASKSRSVTEPRAGGPRYSILIRRTHLLAALFLTPWTLMYAVSTITMHHEERLVADEGGAPEFEVVSERAYTPPEWEGRDPWSVARDILRDLDLEGAFSTSGSLGEGTFTIFRSRPLESYRVSVLSEAGMIRVERRDLHLPAILEGLHRRRGFDQPFTANLLWGLSVDLFILAILIWAITGLWMWWEMDRTHKLGAICLSLGSAAFVFFLVVL